MDNIVINVTESVEDVTIEVVETELVENVTIEVVEMDVSGAVSMWETDGATNIKPKNNKLVDAGKFTGVLTGGLFHP